MTESVTEIIRACRVWVRDVVGIAFPRTLARVRACRGRGWEREQLLLARFSDAGRAAIDVGANTGKYSLPMTRYFSRVVCLEPNAHLADYLRRTLNERAVVVAAAAGQRCGGAWLTIPKESGRAHIGGNIHSGASLVPVVSLDLIAEMIAPAHVGLVKIDVEGAEHGVLQGGLQVLRDHRPVIIVEIEEQHEQSREEETFGLMQDLDYNGYEMTVDNSLRLVSPRQRRSNNVVFVPCEMSV